MAIGRAQEHEIQYDKHAYNHCSKQEPLFLFHGILLMSAFLSECLSNSSAVGLRGHLRDTPDRMPLSATDQDKAL